MEPKAIRQAAEKLVKLYSSDLDDTLGNELIHFGELVAETLVHLTILSTEWDVIRRFNLDNILLEINAARMHSSLVFEKDQHIMYNQI